MKLNTDKCHVLVPGYEHEYVSVLQKGLFQLTGNCMAEN